ncbi:hypothetical protein LCGC14_1459830 [marine sediment metagenome]|uniref:Uncharacterized protein n=1 Tax=marine sediment metagenome TaxID=412755 RepID=A0A0F9MHF0_9ZZZZ
MTAREMQIAFESWFEHASVDHGLISDEVFRYINEAQDIVVDQIFAKFEQDQILVDDLRVLVEKDAEVDALYAGGDSAINGLVADYATIPTNYRFMISARSEIKYNRLGITVATDVKDAIRTISGSFTTSVVPVRIAQSDDIHRLLLDPFNRTRFREPLGVVNGLRLLVHTDSLFICERFLLNYIRTPDQVSIDGSGTDCELPAHLHRVIVDTAIDRFVQRGSLIGKMLSLQLQPES